MDDEVRDLHLIVSREQMPVFAPNRDQLQLVAQEKQLLNPNLKVKVEICNSPPWNVVPKRITVGKGSL